MPFLFAEIMGYRGTGTFEIRNSFGHATKYPNEDAEEAAGVYNSGVSGEVLLLIITIISSSLPCPRRWDYGGSMTLSSSNTVWPSRSLEVPG